MHNKLFNALERIKDKRVTIVGDLMLDKYQWGEVERISPEAPVPVVRIEREEFFLGGAGNVARNVKRLGGRPYLISVVGKDQAGQAVQKLLEREGIENELVEIRGRDTTEKVRIIARNQQVVRVDKDPGETIKEEDIQNICRLSRQNPAEDFIIASDYGKGVVCGPVLNELTKTFKVVLDPKTVNRSFYKDLFLMTPNMTEAFELDGSSPSEKKDILDTGKRLVQKYRLTSLVITMGAEGMAIFEQNEVRHIPTLAQNVFDVTGAGDTVIAALALSLQAGNDLLSSCQLANAAAGHVVSQVGTAAASICDVRKVIQEKKKCKCEDWGRSE
ncbi:MAG: bifunctional heptose 7-phosphate kinase/heptose 1-phosphate adenyltransferase [Desulfonatronovibrionaceae bacterium]